MTVKDHQHEWVPFGVAAFVADYQPDIDQHELDALHAVYLCNDPECGAWTDDVLDADDRVDADAPADQSRFLSAEHRLAGAEPPEQPGPTDDDGDGELPDGVTEAQDDSEAGENAGEDA